ncbi:ferredoxin--NADP reductase [Thiothrix fructosivorans]|uniref:ferredoxin--NADP(+) reductase n=1 Tax=Thiothrix fructosivorans TaxID=111770 RepID=A0A8B0SKK9_9GAMM|nr:ferredoxin--NADP reductase [Thiothrix fructosivorans]MBO0611755.1 ferredoxin--NADP reductase [Thiothrix fructosivorans]QTX10588.1 ferredoxin--NADP reductase [Thiothrix fructosivorans]
MTGIIRTTWHNAEVLSNQHWTDRLLTLHIKTAPMPFVAGQFVTLRLPVTTEGVTELVAKSYSLINAPDEAALEIFYNIVPNGKLSNALARLQPGDSLEISQPAKGFFVLDEIPAVPNLWMIATGTGLGPYLSILQTAQPWQRFQKIVLVHGTPLVNELAYAELIQTLAAAHPEQFRFISCVTREVNPHGLEGRITTSLESGALEQVAGTSISATDTHVMLCGNHNMLNDMKALLGKRGMQRHLRHKPGHITTEQYF